MRIREEEEIIVMTKESQVMGHGGRGAQKAPSAQVGRRKRTALAEERDDISAHA